MGVGERIGSGQTAEIYALGSDRAVKRYEDRVPRDVAEREYANSMVADDAGLSVPSVYELTSIDGNPGLVFERIRGETMHSRVRSRPWTIRRYARCLARLHTDIHTIHPAGLRPVRKGLRRNIRDVSGLEQEDTDRVLSVLAQLPAGDSLCHGDFHPENVLLAEEPVVVDWLDAGYGHPAADVARTNLILTFAGQYVGRTASLILTIFRRWYLRFYLRRNSLPLEQIRAWELPVAVARLTENVPEEAQLRSFISSRLGTE